MNRICTQEKDPVEIVFAIIEQLESFQVLKSNNLRFFDPMVSELKRLQTFKNWPHPEYRMAVPSKLAESGFFHTPAETHPDRCTCFYCLIALVSWEPTDEGWTEHKRHSPTCNFILGKPTGNIPISLSLRSSPGIKHSEDVFYKRHSLFFLITFPFFKKFRSLLNSFLVIYKIELLLLLHLKAK